MQTSYKRDYSALYIGKVLDNEDPEGLGRCKIDIPDVYGTVQFSQDSLPWSIPLVPNVVSGTRGSVNIPDVGDCVWVLFLGANRSSPVYIGGFYSSADSIEVNPKIVDLYIEEGNKISYDRDNKTYTVIANENKVVLSLEDILVEHSAGNKVNITEKDILVEHSAGNKVNITEKDILVAESKGNKIVVSPENIDLSETGGNKVNVSSSGIILEGNVTIVGKLEVTDTINSEQEVSAPKVSAQDIAGQTGTIHGADIATEGMSQWDQESIMEVMNITEEDLANMTEEEKKSYLFFQEIIAAGDTDGDPSTPPDEAAMAAKAKELGVGGNGLNGGYCQAFALWSTRAAQGTSENVTKYESAKDCMNNADLSTDFSNIPVGSTIVGDSTYTPEYGHAVVYAGDGMVMHVVDTGEIRYQSLDDLTSEGWFTPAGWTNLHTGGGN